MKRITQLTVILENEECEMVEADDTAAWTMDILRESHALIDFMNKIQIQMICLACCLTRIL